MENNKLPTTQNKKQYTTVIGFLVRIVSLLVITTLLGWFLLMLWFISQALLNGGILVQHNINGIINYNLGFINSHKISLFSYAASWIHLIQEVISLAAGTMFSFLNNALNQINYHSSLADSKTIQLIITIIFGTAEIAMTRLLVFFMSMPLLFSMLVIAVIDGLGQRDIRKFNGSRESTFYFHRIKPLTGKIFYLLVLLFISLPIVVTHHYLLVLIVSLLGLMTMLTIKSYKKYL